LTNTVTKHPYQRFEGRKIRKRFEVDNVKKKRTSRVFEGKVNSYNEKRLLLQVKYELDGSMRKWIFTNSCW
jgi:hypothetical protein